MIINIIDSYRVIITLCDKELLGKCFEEGELLLDVKENFFGGKHLPKEEISNLLQDYAKEDAKFNIVGEKSVHLALEEGLINEEGIKRIQGIPFSLVLI